jgi:DNA-binding NtrC family response regulator
MLLRSLRTSDATPSSNASGSAESRLTFREGKEKFIAHWEREFFISALRAAHGNISRAAEQVGMYGRASSRRCANSASRSTP